MISDDNMSTMAEPTASGPQRRMPAQQRQQQILDAAVKAFAEYGYSGATTDQIARLAGVSQPYVVRMFGGKHALFIAAHTYVVDRIEAMFRDAVAQRDASVSPLAALQQIYIGQLVPDPNMLKLIQHGYTMAFDPQFGPAVRNCLVRTYRLVRELTGATPEQARDFVAAGLLVNTMITLQLLEVASDDPYAAELVQSVIDGAVPGSAN